MEDNRRNRNTRIRVVAGLAGVAVVVSLGYTARGDESAEWAHDTATDCKPAKTDDDCKPLKKITGNKKSGGDNKPEERGTELPDTAYPIPQGDAQTIFLSPTGDDENEGTRAKPFKSIEKAITSVPSGGTIVFRNGVYRDGTTTRISKPVTLQPYPHEKVWLDGTNIEKDWKQVGDTWELPFDASAFCDGKFYTRDMQDQDATKGPCTYKDQLGDPANPMAADPTRMFIDGENIPQVANAKNADGARFFHDQAARKLILGMNPDGHKVEVTHRATALFLEGGEGGVMIRGLGFRRYATSNFPEAATHGAVVDNTPRTTYENDAFIQNSGAGLQIADPRQDKVINSVFGQNGGNGIAANGHSRTPGIRDDLLVEGSLIAENNQENFGEHCSYSCQAAGIKMAHMVGYTFRNNDVLDQVGSAHGMWSDMDGEDGLIEGNTIRKKNDEGIGIFDEISNKTRIKNNKIKGGHIGIKIGSANVTATGNDIQGANIGALLYDDDRSDDWYGGAGPDTVNIEFTHNNLNGYTVAGVQLWRTEWKNSKSTGPNIFVKKLDVNTYGPAKPGLPLVIWREKNDEPFSNLASLRSAKGVEKHGKLLK